MSSHPRLSSLLLHLAAASHGCISLYYIVLTCQLAVLQEQGQGVGPSARPEAPPQRHGLSQVAGIALGIAVFGAAVWSLVTVWKRKDDKLHRPDRQSNAISRSKGRGSRSDQKRRRKHEYQEFAPEELAEVRGRIICRQFARTGTCKYGDDCWYRHERDPEAISAAAEAVGRYAMGCLV